MCLSALSNSKLVLHKPIQQDTVEIELRFSGSKATPITFINYDPLASSVQKKQNKSVIQSHTAVYSNATRKPPTTINGINARLDAMKTSNSIEAAPSQHTQTSSSMSHTQATTSNSTHEKISQDDIRRVEMEFYQAFDKANKQATQTKEIHFPFLPNASKPLLLATQKSLHNKITPHSSSKINEAFLHAYDAAMEREYPELSVTKRT